MVRRNHSQEMPHSKAKPRSLSFASSHRRIDDRSCHDVMNRTCLDGSDRGPATMGAAFHLPGEPPRLRRRRALADARSAWTAVFDRLYVCLAPCTQSIITRGSPFVKALLGEFEGSDAGWVELTNSWARAKRVTSQYESVLWNAEVKLRLASPRLFGQAPGRHLARPDFLGIMNMQAESRVQSGPQAGHPRDCRLIPSLFSCDRRSGPGRRGRIMLHEHASPRCADPCRPGAVPGEGSSMSLRKNGTLDGCQSSRSAGSPSGPTLAVGCASRSLASRVLECWRRVVAPLTVRDRRRRQPPAWLVPTK